MRRNRTEVSLPLTITDAPAAVVDYGPVFDLKVKNMNLQQEINQLRHRLSELEYKEKRDSSMLNLLRTQELKEGARFRDMSPSKQGDDFADELQLSMRGSPSKTNMMLTQSMPPIPEEASYKELSALRDQIIKLNQDNHNLKNQVSLLKSELISVAHGKMPPELTSPISKQTFNHSGNQRRRQHHVQQRHL